MFLALSHPNGFSTAPFLLEFLVACLSFSLSFCLFVDLLSDRLTVCVCVCVCAEWICMRASRVTLLSHAKACVEQIGLVGCRDSTHISLNKSACAAVVHVCVSVCECVRVEANSQARI